MKKFELFLSSGLLVSGSTVEDWLKTPADGIQAVVFLHDNGFAQEQIHGFNYYILMPDDTIVGSDVLEPGAAKRGELIDTQLFNQIVDSIPQRSKIWDR